MGMEVRAKRMEGQVFEDERWNRILRVVARGN